MLTNHFGACRSIIPTQAASRSASLPARWLPLVEERDLPWLVFFQGGPGYAAPRPMDNSELEDQRAVQEYTCCCSTAALVSHANL